MQMNEGRLATPHRTPLRVQDDPPLGLQVRGQDPGVSFSSLEEATANARVLLERGYDRVAVFDRISGKILRRFKTVS